MHIRTLNAGGMRLAVVSVVLAVAFFSAATTASAVVNGTFSGTIVASSTGDPIPSANVSFWRWNGSFWNWTAAAVANLDGVYQVSMAPGDYQALFQATGFAYQAWPNGQWMGLPGASTVTIVSGLTTTVDARLVPGATLSAKASTEATGGSVADLEANFMADDLDSTFWSSTFLDNSLSSWWTGRRVEASVAQLSGFANSYYRNAAGSTIWRSVAGTNTIPIGVRHMPDTYHDAIRKTGGNRWQAAVTASWENTTSPGAHAVNWRYVTDVVIASGDDAGAADALSAAGLAGVYNLSGAVPGAPLLLVGKNSLNTEVKNALNAMPGPIDVHIVGGSAVVSDHVKDQIEALSPVHEVDRVSGTDRYKTAVAVANRMKIVLSNEGEPLPDTVLIANGQDPTKFSDALALSPVAWAKHAPILLVGKDTLPTSTKNALSGFAAGNRYIAGGSATVSEATRVKSGVSVANRLWGSSRYYTAAKIATKAVSAGWVPNWNIGVAATQPDALAGGVSIAQTGGVLLLTSPTGLPTATKTWIEDNPPYAHAFIYGSKGSIPESQRLQIQGLIN